VILTEFRVEDFVNSFPSPSVLPTFAGSSPTSGFVYSVWATWGTPLGVLKKQSEFQKFWILFAKSGFT
jgi:hypothetical protein